MLFSALYRKCMRAKLVKLLGALYSHTYYRVKLFNVSSSSFETTSGIQEGCLIYLFWFNFFKFEVMEDALNGLCIAGVELVTREKLCDLDYAGNFVCLFQSKEHAQYALNRIAGAVAPVRLVDSSLEFNI